MTNAFGLIKGEISQKWETIPVDDVIVRERQRKLNEQHVCDVMRSFRDLGGQLQIQPIVIDENNVLIDGAHRLEAAKRSGWTHISALRLTGVTSEDRALLEAEANRVRLQLTPVEIEEVWKEIYEPAFKARAKKSQVSGLRQGEGTPVIGNDNNGESGKPTSLVQAAKEVTGYSLDTINKVTDIKSAALSGTINEEVREAAQLGLTKLDRPGASVDAVHKSLLALQDRISRHSEDPTETQRAALEKRLDKTLTDTTLLAERLEGELGEELKAAAAANQTAADSLRSIRIALTHALAQVVTVECSLEGDPTVNMQRIGKETSRLLSERTLKALGLEVDHG